MTPGRESRTAALVCMGRALAQGTTSVSGFSDPTAFELLPDDARAFVAGMRAGVPPQGMRAQLRHAYHARQSKLMVVRTVAIDDAVRAADSPQLVILGAGLDGRAWRMPELRGAVVFEVDHPDSQREKRRRAVRLSPVAREVRFVPVDFACGGLEDALGSAGHDPSRRTTWVWEGVVMYLSRPEAKATLAAVARRSAPGSRLIILYHTPTLLLRAIGVFVRRLGEPLRSAYSVEEMRALLSGHGFRVIEDRGLPEIAAAMPRDVAEATAFAKHMRLATAERMGSDPVT